MYPRCWDQPLDRKLSVTFQIMSDTYSGCTQILTVTHCSLLPFMVRNSSLCGSETTACLECPKSESKTATKTSSLSHCSPFSAGEVNTARGLSTSGKRQARHGEDVHPHLPKPGLYFLHTCSRDNYQQWWQWLNLVLMAASNL